MIPLVYHSIYSALSLPDGHRYPIEKYRLLHESLRCSGKLQGFHEYTPQPLTLADVCEVHDSDYVHALASGELALSKMRRIGFPWSEQLIARTLTSAGGTCLTARLAIEHGIALHTSGGYHHAHFDFGSGFCLFNDLVLAAHNALKRPEIDKVLIIDSDVHHGDGSASLCQSRDDIVTLSFHCDKNFPARKPDSDFDIPLPKGCEDDEFLRAFSSGIELAIRLAQPDLIIYDAGVDIHQDDELGYLNVSLDAIRERDYFVLNLARQLNMPIACVIGGGYRHQTEYLLPLHESLFDNALALFGEQSD